VASCAFCDFFHVGKQLTILTYGPGAMAARAAIHSHSAVNSHSKRAGLDSHDVLSAIFSQAPMTHREYISVIGLLLAVVSNIVIAGALNLQKIAGLKAKDEGLDFHKSRRWWAAVILMCVGEFGNFTAYAFAPATLVAPLGAVSVVANSAISSLLGLEAFRFQDIVGTALVVCGGCVLVLFAPAGEANFSLLELESYLLGGVFLVYIGLVLSVYIMLHLYRIHSSNRSGPVIDLVMTAIIGSVTVQHALINTSRYYTPCLIRASVLQVLATKGFSTSLRRTIQGRENAFSSPLTYAMFVVILVTAAIQVRDINRALMRYGTSQVMPVYYVLFTLASICGSVVLYHEFAVVSGTRRLIFLAGCCITFFGVILITGNRDSECSTEVATEETDDVLLEFLGPSSSLEDRERVHSVLLSGGIGLALGLVLTPVCFPMFLCCSTLLGAGVGGAAAELKDNRKMHHVDSSIGMFPALPCLFV
jgi:magnesium transporter